MSIEYSLQSLRPFSSLYKVAYFTLMDLPSPAHSFDHLVLIVVSTPAELTFAARFCLNFASSRKLV